MFSKLTKFTKRVFSVEFFANFVSFELFVKGSVVKGSVVKGSVVKGFVVKGAAS